MPKLLIFELDGGSWTIVEPLLREGRLPHIASLIQRGASGTLNSIRPMVSPALWTTIYTGQPSETHGALAFDATSSDVRYPRLWDIAYAHGMTCGVCGSLVTWPPYDVGGFMIPDIMARDTTTIPPHVAPLQELVLKYPRTQKWPSHGLAMYFRHATGLIRAGIRVETLSALAREVLTASLLHRPYRDTYWRRTLLLQQLYADVCVRLCYTRRPDLVTYHYHAVDLLSHRYWKDYESGGHQPAGDGKPYREVIPNAYESADRTLGHLMKMADASTTVVLLSDHGFRSTGEVRARYTGRLVRWIETLGLDGAATPTRLGQQHFLYFRDMSLMKKAEQALRSAHFEETGTPVIPQVVTRDSSLFFRPPQIRGEGMTVVIPGYTQLPFEELFEDTNSTETGAHDEEGIAILAGPMIRPAAKLEGCSILDVMPTALAILNLPLARDMQGRVWWEALRSPPTAQSLDYVDTYQREAPGTEATELSEKDTQVLYRRLDDLGYL
jgi:hypothetical protein